MLIRRSPLFDAEWYRRGLAEWRGEGEVAVNDPAAHYLQFGWRAGLSPSPAFDGAWYLRANADVAEAGLNPLVHYLRYGQAEGRLPRQNRAIAWEHHLWAGLDDLMVPRLTGLLDDPEASAEEVRYAAWALGRWAAWQNDWQAAAELLCRYQDLQAPFPAHNGPVLLAIEAFWRTGDTPQARALLEEWLMCRPDQADFHLAQANLLSSEADSSADVDSRRLAAINAPLTACGLAPLGLRDAAAPLSLDNLQAAGALSAPDDAAPWVSVIVPVYNAADTVTTALDSLFAQTWRNLEILVVDDASDDATWRVLEKVAGRCPAHQRLRLLQHPVNRGAYAARNTGLAAASGDLITTHDSDDWSHPQKIEWQVRQLLERSTARASVSHWVRTTPALIFHRWRIEEGWIYRNVSSLMFRREVFAALGYWDNVRVNADTEYYYRIIAAYGEDAVVEVFPGVPLAFGRADGGSLSQHSDTHLVTQFGGVRKKYMDAARRWHRAVCTSTQPEPLQRLYLPAEASVRPFPAPRAIAVEGEDVVEELLPLDLIQQSGLLDEAWYIRQCDDLHEQIVDPLEHYYHFGAAEGRDPGPNFSSSGYRRYYSDVGDSDQNPLVHFLTRGVAENREPLPVFPGSAPARCGLTVLLCAHAAGTTLYGAERSLLDLLAALNELGMNVIVTLPGAQNADYLAALRAHALAVAVLPYGWWQRGKRLCEETVGHFEGLIQRFKVDAVHVNTVVLNEPLHAARRAGVPLLIHVRELLEHDAALCASLHATADEVYQRVLSMADGVVANSRCVVDALARCTGERDAHAAIHVVGNTVAMAPLLALPPPLAEGGMLRVGMMSSNVAKKGLVELEAVAAHLERMGMAQRVLCRIYGPKTPEVESLLARQACGEAPANMEYRGYVAAPEEALRELDVLVNFSLFQESFGRTVLEGMASGRAIVCYDWGALPELVVEGATGYLVPRGDTQAAAARLAQLAADPEGVVAMGQAGRQRAVEKFSSERVADALRSAYEKTLGHAEVERARHVDAEAG